MTDILTWAVVVILMLPGIAGIVLLLEAAAMAIVQFSHFLATDFRGTISVGVVVLLFAAGILLLAATISLMFGVSSECVSSRFIDC